MASGRRRADVADSADADGRRFEIETPR